MKKRVLVALVVVLVLVAPASVVWGQDTTVCRVPDDYATIQAAVDDMACDVIIVAPGTWDGATVTRAVEIRGEEDAVIDNGPNSHSFLRAGFLFPGGGVGSGATISGFTFQGTPQSGYADDSNLDFPIFSRGANNVTVKNNVMFDSLQAITNWHGSGWHIRNNVIDDLWTLCGGGIGILVGSNNGTPSDNNIIAFNSISATDVDPVCAPYSTPGIVLMSDARWGPGGPVQDNKVLHNDVSVTGSYGDTDTGVGIELTDLVLETGGSATVTNNKVMQNDPFQSTVTLALNPLELEDYNVIHNNPGQGPGHGLPPASIY